MNTKFDTIIIGAGAAGMTAAIFAARRGLRVCIIEKRSEPGRKILQTGNGKCNMTHEKLSAQDYYRAGAPEHDFLKKAFSVFGYDDTLKLFASLGVPVRVRDGYIYPYSERALSVRNALRDELKALGVSVMTDTSVSDLSAEDEGFFLTLESGDTKAVRINSTTLVLATGLFAGAPQRKGDFSGIDMAMAFGLEVKEPCPVLVKLRVKGDLLKPAAGVRHKALLELYSENVKSKEIKTEAREFGEVQFTEDAVSGIPAFQLSRYAARLINEDKRIFVRADLLPDLTERQLEAFVNDNFTHMKSRRIKDFLGGMLSDKLITALARGMSLSADKRLYETDIKTVRELLFSCKNFTVEIEAPYSFEAAQVCTGGVILSEINPESMQIRKCPGLFVAGELVDIDGPCGGYNLQWAWTSGAIAGGAC